MATEYRKIKVRRSTTALLAPVVLASGEPAYFTDSGYFFIGNGTDACADLEPINAIRPGLIVGQGFLMDGPGILGRIDADEGPVQHLDVIPVELGGVPSVESGDSDGDVLTIVDGVPTWVPSSSLPPVESGDLDGYVLTLVDGAPVWAPSGAVPAIESGDVNGDVLTIVGGVAAWAAKPLLHFMWSFNPKAVCDGTIDRLFLMTVGPDFPNGLKITRWNCSFDADPATEADLDFKRADAFIGVGSSAVMDVLDTTAGVSSETTAANINSGNAVANGKVIYLEFGTAYAVDNLQMIFEFWGYAV